jgi:hypothetical protein
LAWVGVVWVIGWDHRRSMRLKREQAEYDRWRYESVFPKCEVIDLRAYRERKQAREEAANGQG